MIGGERHYIHELFPKIRGVAPNMRVLAEKLAEKRTTLESRLKSRTGLMSIAEQQALAEALGFKITWPEWRDREASADTHPADRRDTADLFLARFRRGAASLTVRVRKSEALAKSFADFSLEAAGQFHLRDDEPIPFFYEIHCEPCEVAKGLVVGIAAFDVQIVLPTNGGVWRHNRAMPRRDEFLMGVDEERHDPYYRFSTKQPPMRFHVNEVMHALGIYDAAKPGDVLEVELRAYLDKTVVERPDGHALGVKRVKVQNHLAKRFVLGEPRECEDATWLGGQTLIIEKL